MSKFHTKHNIHYDNEHVAHGHVIELTDDVAAPLVALGHLAPAQKDAEITHTFMPKKKGVELSSGSNSKSAAK